jgi:hypothetical protein
MNKLLEEAVSYALIWYGVYALLSYLLHLLR